MDVAVKPVSPISTGQIAPQVAPVDPKVGAGVAGAVAGSGNLPPPGGVADDLGAAFASLAGFMPNQESPELVCAVAAAKIAEILGKASHDEIKVDNQRREEAVARRLASAQKAIDELAKQSDGDWWDAVKTVCDVVVSVVSIIAGWTAMASGVGGPIGVLLIANGVCGLISATDSTLNMTTGHGIAGNLHLLTHPGDEEGANKADESFRLSFAIAQTTVGLMTLACGDPTQLNNGILQLGTKLVKIGGDVAVGYINYDSASHQVAGRRARADEQIAQAAIEQIDEYVQQAIKRLTTTSESWARVIEETADTLRNKASVTSRVRFA
ncbi:hypothetical protein XH83_13080 [Bradyrhizobium sp. CCBAU 53351]|uniref:hypothetical protein n=1 Tax=Bradyrhizobium sp. CCBAU 53351 TaxID=1325114 RepID=UPI0018886915|nr:hypothetical protein [Bradyrhizobium sp. CCBAU 53351]QOZ76295.1 hypothetical protein XH83_13080 [Bradyrhizobium sp. CCBAU 53351]